jgi:hypothetical protein
MRAIQAEPIQSEVASQTVMQRYDKLDVGIIHRPAELDADGNGKHERFTVDFLINGQSLYDLLSAHRRDLAGRFSQGAQVWNEESAHIFLTMKPADLKNGRIMLYVCPECGDIGCGAITVRVTKSDESYIWTEFGYENDYDSEMTDLDSYRLIGPFQFKVDEYCEAIEKAKSA